IPPLRHDLHRDSAREACHVAVGAPTVSSRLVHAKNVRGKPQSRLGATDAERREREPPPWVSHVAGNVPHERELGRTINDAIHCRTAAGVPPWNGPVKDFDMGASGRGQMQPVASVGL
ncbi:MAG: hypothetical protein M3Z25_22705, partial [Actinomycetota bacterium]|nr:hypothetical protein [Actinomycetota bacterium]